MSAKPPSHGNCAELWRASLVRTGLLGPLRVASQGFADTPVALISRGDGLMIHGKAGGDPSHGTGAMEQDIRSMDA